MHNGVWGQGTQAGMQSSAGQSIIAPRSAAAPYSEHSPTKHLRLLLYYTLSKERKAVEVGPLRGWVRKSSRYRLLFAWWQVSREAGDPQVGPHLPKTFTEQAAWPLRHPVAGPTSELMPRMRAVALRALWSCAVVLALHEGACQGAIPAAGR